MAIRFYYLALRERGRSTGLGPEVRFIFTPRIFFYGPARVVDAAPGSPRGKDLARARSATDGLSHARARTESYAGVHVFAARACMSGRADGIGRIINP